MSKINNANLDEALLLHIPGVVIFPGMSFPITVTGEKAIRALDQAYQNGRQIILTTASPNIDIGCSVNVLSFKLNADHNAKVILQGISRSRVSAEPDCASIGEKTLDIYRESNQADRQVQRKNLIEVMLRNSREISGNPLLLPALECELAYGTICDLLAASLPLNDQEYCSILSELDVDQRGNILLDLINQYGEAAHPNEFPPVFSLN